MPKNNDDRSATKVTLNWYPGHMAKTKKEILQDLKLIDIVIELLDARIPISSRNPDIHELTKGKTKIILLNKSDLADDNISQKWIQALQKEGIVLLTDSNSGKGIDKVLKTIEKLRKEKNQKYEQRGIINKTIRVMILGIPNVGKSSLINRLSKKTSMEVGNKPGVTKKKQWVRLGTNQELLDTPGVLWPKFESQEVALHLAFTGTIKDDILDRIEIAYELLKKLWEIKREVVLQRYKIDGKDLEKVEEENNKIYALLQLIGQKRGALIQGGMVDDEKTARIVLEDFRSGKLRKNYFRGA